MKVSSISTYPKNTQTNFRSSSRVVYKKVANKTYSNFTLFLRPDLSWNGLMNLMKEKYNTVDKVNIINHACSDGSESYSLAMLLKEKFGEDSKKFFPIKAYDFDDKIIEKAKSKNIVILHEDMLRLSQNIPDWREKYLKIIPSKGYGTPIKAQPKEEINDTVIFEQKNILYDFNENKLSNTVIVSRNFWPYLKLAEQEYLAKKLYEKMDDSCLLVLGALEQSYAIDKLLEEKGFVPTSVRMIYTVAKK